MFKKKVDKELDVTNLNNIIRTGKKILGIYKFKKNYNETKQFMDEGRLAVLSHYYGLRLLY